MILWSYAELFGSKCRWTFQVLILNVQVYELSLDQPLYLLKASGNISSKRLSVDISKGLVTFTESIYVHAQKTLFQHCCQSWLWNESKLVYHKLRNVIFIGLLTDYLKITALGTGRRNSCERSNVLGLFMLCCLYLLDMFNQNSQLSPPVHCLRLLEL